MTSTRKLELDLKKLLLSPMCEVGPVRFTFLNWQPHALENLCWWKFLASGPVANKQAWKWFVICLLINDWFLQAVSLVSWEEKPTSTIRAEGNSSAKHAVIDKCVIGRGIVFWKETVTNSQTHSYSLSCFSWLVRDYTCSTVRHLCVWDKV